MLEYIVGLEISMATVRTLKWHKLSLNGWFWLWTHEFEIELSWIQLRQYLTWESQVKSTIEGSSLITGS